MGATSLVVGQVLPLVSLQLSTQSIGTSLDLLLEKTFPDQTLCTSHDSSALTSTTSPFHRGEIPLCFLPLLEEVGMYPKALSSSLSW